MIRSLFYVVTLCLISCTYELDSDPVHSERPDEENEIVDYCIKNGFSFYAQMDEFSLAGINPIDTSALSVNCYAILNDSDKIAIYKIDGEDFEERIYHKYDGCYKRTFIIEDLQNDFFRTVEIIYQNCRLEFHYHIYDGKESLDYVYFYYPSGEVHYYEYLKGDYLNYESIKNEDDLSSDFEEF